MPATSRRKPLKDSPAQSDISTQATETVRIEENTASVVSPVAQEFVSSSSGTPDISSPLVHTVPVKSGVEEVVPINTNNGTRNVFAEPALQSQPPQQVYSQQRSFQQNGRQQQRLPQRDMRFRNTAQPAPRPVVPVIDPHPDFIATHEIFIPRENNMLEYSYNAGYTEAKLARSSLLDQLKEETDAGARSRCWNCNAVRVMHVVWHSEIVSFGDIGVALCEKCSSWSVM